MSNVLDDSRFACLLSRWETAWLTEEEAAELRRDVEVYVGTPLPERLPRDKFPEDMCPVLEAYLALEKLMGDMELKNMLESQVSDLALKERKACSRHNWRMAISGVAAACLAVVIGTISYVNFGSRNDEREFFAHNDSASVREILVPQNSTADSSSLEMISYASGNPVTISEDKPAMIKNAVKTERTIYKSCKNISQSETDREKCIRIFKNFDFRINIKEGYFKGKFSGNHMPSAEEISRLVDKMTSFDPEILTNAMEMLNSSSDSYVLKL